MAEEKKEDLIDLDKLSHRELLIVCARDVRELKSTVGSLQTEQHKMSLEVNTIKTRSRIWGGIMGVFGAGATAILERLLNR